MKELDDYRDVELSYMDHLGNHRYTWDSFAVENPIKRDDGKEFVIPTSWDRKAWKNTSLVFRVELMMIWIQYTREHPNVGEPV